MRYLMGLDNGGTVSKAAIFDENGNQIASASEYTQVITPQPGFAERDLAELWAVNARVAQKAIQKSKLDAKDIVGVSFSGHGKGLYLIDKAGKPLGNGILSMDNRAYAYVDKWNQDGTAAKVREMTKQPLVACQPPLLLAYLRDHEPERYAKIGGIFGVNDFIRYMLTGEAYAEYGNFSGGNLIDFMKKDYSEDLMSLYGLQDLMQALPPLRHAGDVCGYVTKEAAELTGLQEGTPVAAGMFDIDAGGLASGLVNENQVAMIAGTWSINEYISKQTVTSKTTMNSFYAIPGYYLIEESSPTSAGNMEWFIKKLMQEEKNTAEAEGKSVYDVTNTWVESVAPEDDEVIFLPYLNGSPDQAQATGTFVGLTLGADKKDMLRAVYEGIVFGHKRHYERLLAHRDKPKSIQLSGGAANSPVWVQMFADILETPIDTVADKELGALGAAMAAGVASGVYSSFAEAAERCNSITNTVYPQPQNYAIYRQKYQRFCLLADTLLPIWKNLTK